LTSHTVPSLQVTALLRFFVQSWTGCIEIYRQRWNPKDAEIYIPQHCSIISFSTSHLYWHVSHVMETEENTPIPKSTNKSLPSGVASKLIEHHAKATTEKFLQVNTPISSSQWGFMSNWSTVSALIRVLDDWKHAVTKCFFMCPKHLTLCLTYHCSKN